MDNNYVRESVRTQEPPTFTKEHIMQFLKAVSDSPPVVIDKEHPPTWWNEQFGKRIREEWKVRIQLLMEHVRNMPNPF